MNTQSSMSQVSLSSDTQYQVIKDVCKGNFHWKLQHDKEATTWDLCWTDNAVQAQTLGRMQAHQKINHFPGMFSLARKNHLARGLAKMKKRYPVQYNFYPETWLLPSEFPDFKQNLQSKQKGKARTYIAKPQAGCQGRGIFLTRSAQSFQPGQHYVVQRYLSKPFLLEGLKFDMRLYVLVAGCDPLRLYLYNQGLGRFATVPYEGPKSQNLGDLCMHLTNYAINKQSQNFVFNKDKDDMTIGHKRSLSSIYQSLRETGLNVEQLLQKIHDIIIKTMIVGQPVLSHHYKACQSVNLANNMCFQVLGFDIIIDHRGKPILLQINHTPSFTTDTPLDQYIKENLIKDTLKLMNISVRSRNEIIMTKKLELQQRMITGKKQKFTLAERKEQIQRLQRIRDKHERKNLGNFSLIYPHDQEQVERYNQMLQYSGMCYEDSTGANIKRNKKISVQKEPNKKTVGVTPPTKKISKQEREKANEKWRQMAMPKLPNSRKHQNSRSKLVKQAPSPPEPFRLQKMDEYLVIQDSLPFEGKKHIEQKIKATGGFIQPKIFMPTFVCQKTELKSNLLFRSASKGEFELNLKR